MCNGVGPGTQRLYTQRDPVLGALVVSPSGWLEGAIADVAVCVTVAPVYELESDGSTPMVVSSAPGAVVVFPDFGEVGSTLANMAMVSLALKNGSRSHRWHQWAKNNSFSPLSELGTEFGEVWGRGRSS